MGRSLQKHEIETQKSLRVSCELLDLDEALNFLEDVATNPEKIPATLAVSTPLEKWKVSPAPSPESHRVSMCDRIDAIYTVMCPLEDYCVSV